MNQLLAEPDAVVEFVTTHNIGEIKTALLEVPESEQAAAAAAVRDIENNRDETPRKGIIGFVDEILDTPSPPDDSAPPAPPPDGDSSPPDDETPEPVAPSGPVVPVTVDRDCTLNIRGQLLKCKAGDVITGAAAAYAVKAGAPVTEVPADTDDD